MFHGIVERTHTESASQQVRRKSMVEVCPLAEEAMDNDVRVTSVIRKTLLAQSYTHESSNIPSSFMQVPQPVRFSDFRSYQIIMFFFLT